MNDLVIIGAGDTGRELVDLVQRINYVNCHWNMIGFVDDNAALQGKIIEGYPVLGNIEWLNNANKEVFAICSISNGQIKKKMVEKIVNDNVKWATLVDPNVQFFKESSCGEGSILYSGTVLAIHATIGRHVYLSLNCTVGHDSVIGDYCCAFPGVNISGKVDADECVDFGTGTKVIQGKHICKNVTFGAGSVVVKDIEEPGTYVGVPVKKIHGGVTLQDNRSWLGSQIFSDHRNLQGAA